MKKWIAMLLCLATAFSMLACGGNQEETPAAPVPETTEAKDYSSFAGIVADPKGWYEEFMALPIANDQMTTQELRQLAVDAFKANMTFEWTPNAPIIYTYELLDRYSDVSLPTGIAYSGLCYCTGVKNATNGTIYKVLNYYDVETGTLDIEAMGDNMLNIISSACANGAIQGWNRVSPDHGIKSMNCSMHETNIVPVGPYTYEPYTYNYKWTSRTASNEIIAANGEEVIYESLALTHMADGLYSSSSWHMMMVSQDPVVVRLPDGKIDPNASYLHVHEQGTGGTKSDNYNYTQENGVAIRPLGTIDNKFTFKQLVDKGYIPFTLKEFIGEATVKAGEAWVGKETSKIENGTEMTVEELFSKSICTNYTLCTVQVQVKAPDGTQLVCYNPHINTSPTTKTASLSEALRLERLEPYADGKNTIHIYAQLSNGEKLEAFSTILKLGE